MEAKCSCDESVMTASEELPTNPGVSSSWPDLFLSKLELPIELSLHLVLYFLLKSVWDSPKRPWPPPHASLVLYMETDQYSHWNGPYESRFLLPPL